MDEVGDEGGHEAGCDGLVGEAAHGEDFDAEDGAGERRPEDGAEAGADAGHEDDAAIGGVEAEEARELVGEGGAGLNGCALAPGGAAEEMGEKGAEEDQRRHAQRDGLFGVVNLFENEVVAGFDGCAKVLVDEADREASGGEQPDEPEVAFADAGGQVKRPEKESGG